MHQWLRVTAKARVLPCYYRPICPLPAPVIQARRGRPARRADCNKRRQMTVEEVWRSAGWSGATKIGGVEQSDKIKARWKQCSSWDATKFSLNLAAAPCDLFFVR